MTRQQEMQRIVRHFKDTTGKKEVDLHEVVRWAVKRGWPLPKPVDPFDRLVRDFAAAQREEVRHDAATGKPYRANHAVPTSQNGQQVFFWVDIDEAPRAHMHKALTLRRDQMIGDGLSLSLDADHWNSIHPTEEPIQIELDFGPDVEWRKNAPDEESEAG